jgi:hypothetical protein
MYHHCQKAEFSWEASAIFLRVRCVTRACWLETIRCFSRPVLSLYAVISRVDVFSVSVDVMLC